MPAQVLIADDHALFRDGLAALLAGSPDFAVAGHAADGREAVRLALSLPVDVVTMDLLMPGTSGIEATQQIKRRRPEVRILAVSEQGSTDHVREALMAGCDGYIPKSARGDELVGAMQFILAGRKFIHPGVSAQVISSFLVSPEKRQQQASGWTELTDRERAIVRLVAEGHTNRSTAEILNKSVKTIEKYRASLMVKLGLRSATDLVLKAVEQGWIDKEHVGIWRESDDTRMDHAQPSRPMPRPSGS